MTKERMDYLKSIAKEYGIPLFIVVEVAEALGPNEDRDGLLIELDDYLTWADELEP